MINKNKKSVTYQATLPDGTILKKKSFNIKTETAYMGICNLNGKPTPSGITDKVQDWPGQQFIKATRM